MHSQLKIGLVLPGVPAYSETFFRSKIEGLQKHGFSVLLFAAGPPKGFDVCPYYPQPLVRGVFPFKWIMTLSALMQTVISRPRVVWKLFQLEHEQGASVFSAMKTILANTHILRHHLDWLHFGFGTMAIGRENLARAMGARMAASLRGFDIAIYPHKHPGCYDLMWKCLDKLHVISEDLKSLAQKDGLNEKTPVIKITPAIDIQKFKRSTSLPETLHQPIRILTVARLHWKKGIEYTVQALAMLKEMGILFQYTLIGEGDEYERLLFTAHQLGISEEVSFAGKKSPDEVKQAMEETDIYLQYSISEGFCNAVLEAQAMGCLCVVSDAEGLPENVIHGVTGWVVPKRRPDLLANRITWFFDQPSDYLRHVQLKAVERVENEFTIEKQLAQFVEFYS